MPAEQSRSGVGTTSVPGCKRSCLELLHANLFKLLGPEKAEVSKAARKVDRGMNFVQWLERFYMSETPRVAAGISDLLTIHNRLHESDHRPDDLAAAICGVHKAQLLDAADGDPGEFVQRVQSVLGGCGERD